MTKLLYANGCSWTAGNGIEYDPSLKNVVTGDISKYQINKNWAYVLSEKLGRKCINEGQGAGSNKRMVRTTCNYIQSLPEEYYKDLLIILGWTSIDRNEIYLQDGEQGMWCLFNASQPVSNQALPFSKTFLRNIDNFQKNYILDIFNYKSNYTYFFQEIYLMSNLLENLGIKYLFFNSLPWTWNLYTAGANIEEEFSVQLAKIRKPNILSTRQTDMSLNVMAEFCRINKLPMAPDHHTMIEGHAAWAEHLYKELLTIYPE
jgi:hypothetical protein